MKKIYRNILLFSLMAIFVLLGYFFILKAWGLKINLKTGNFIKTGGIYINVLNKNAKIFLNEKPIKSDSFFANKFFIKNLIPKKYQLKAKADGYFSWSKELKVKQGKVTRAKNIILFKKNQKFNAVLSNVKKIIISKDNKNFLAEKEGKNWEWLIFNPETKNKEKIVSFNDLEKGYGTSLADFGNGLELLDWNQTEGQILFKNSSSACNGNPCNKDRYLLVDFKSGENIKIFEFKGNKDIEKICQNPLNRDEILELIGGNLFKKSKTEDFIKEKELTLPDDFSDSRKIAFFKEKNNINKKGVIFIPQIVSFYKKAGTLFYLNASGFIIKLDKNGKNTINKVPLEQGKVKSFKVYELGKEVFLSSKSLLYELDKNKGLFKEISNNFKEMAVSPDQTKAVLIKGREIWIFDSSNANKKFTFLVRFSKPYGCIAWISPKYIIFTIGNDIKISETDKRGLLNIITIASFEKPKIFFSNYDKKVYVLSNGLLFASEKLIP